MCIYIQVHVYISISIDIYICLYLFIYMRIYTYISIKGPHTASHGQGEATSQHHHRGQQTLRHEVTQAWGLEACFLLLTSRSRLILSVIDFPERASVALGLTRLSRVNPSYNLFYLWNVTFAYTRVHPLGLKVPCNY